MNVAVQDPVIGGDGGMGDGGMSDDDWENLLAEIQEGQCTPFLGSGASAPLLPTGPELAERLARRYGLEVEADAHLPRVSQNISLLGKDPSMRRFIRDLCAERGQPDFDAPTQLHRVLAKLPLSIYITTNYDNFMALALKLSGKTPIVDLCAWFSVGWDEPDSALKAVGRAVEVSETTPLVYHLHGAFSNLESIVLTEDDYLDFLTATSVRKSLVPTNVESSFSEKTLLFLGYNLEDMTFKVLLRRISATIRRSQRAHLTVQLRHDSVPVTAADKQRVEIREAYVHKLLGNNARVYWGSCEKFASELAEKWNRFSTKHPPRLARPPN